MNSMLFIVGFMASGKSTVSKLLSEALSVPYLDTDEEIERLERMSVDTIINSKGEHFFRSSERNLLNNIPIERKIVSCGGGLPCFSDNILTMKKLGTILYFSSSLDTLVERLSIDSTRPLVQGKDAISLKKWVTETYHSRKLYYHLSDIEVDNNISLEKLISVLKQNNIV